MPDSTTTSAMNDGVLSLPSRSIESAPRDRITAIASGMQRHPIVIVLGMHRSGTSLCSHILSALGVDMSDKVEGPGSAALTPDNPHGHWERWEIVEVHDRILHLFNRDYFGQLHDFALPVAWWADPRVVQIRRDIVTFLDKRLGEGYFGFKDPRTVRLMPLWHQILRELRLSPKVVFCLRNPAHVARSLHVRDGLDPEVGEYRWLVHVIDFFRYSNSLDFCTVEYEDWFIDPFVNLNKFTQFLDLPWRQSQSELALLLSGIIDPRARHDGHDHPEARQPLVRSLYKLASRADKDIAARDQIGSIVAQFVGFQQLQKPFQQAFEDVTKVAAGLPEIEQEMAALRAAAGERDALIAAQRTQLDQLTNEHEARIAIETEGNVLRAALAEREAALAELSRQANELSTAVQSAQAERTAQQEALVRAEQMAQQQAASVAALQAEAEALREALALAEQRAAAAEARQSEIAALQEALAQAEHTGKEHAATAEAAQAE
ncbi:MAG: hypothetical protein JO358_08995, partial [Alphaproteobacteria bacterium]|nr:hypothetical protein [Alphaproteobacteria bacterium]